MDNLEKVTVSLDSFVGPLDLLLHLIDKNEIDISDIPIAELTEQYIMYIESYSQTNLMDSLSDFVLMAATLLEIKSKMLLPQPPKDDPSVDPREELALKLIEYKMFKQAADELAARKLERVFRKPLFTKTAQQPTINELLDSINPDILYEIFQSVIKQQELKIDKVHGGFNSIKREVFTVNEKIAFIRHKLTNSREIIFSQIFEGNGTIRETIVTFLAVLELIKREEVGFRQEDTFGDIVLFNR